jgi:hypothetical protein
MRFPETSTPSTLPPALTEDRLSALARTLDRADRALWLLDPQGECLYRNARAAGAARPSNDPAAAVEVVDHEGRMVGRLLYA